MTTAFSVIAGAFVAALETAPAVSNNITRADRRRIEEEADDAVNVQFDGAEPGRAGMYGSPIDWRSRIVVECKARSMSATGDIAVDSLLASVYARLAVDSTLGGLVDDIGEPVIEAAYDAHGQKTGWMRLTYTVLHRTANGSIS